MTEHDLRIAFVVQRYGLDVNGGAELHCRWVAEHLARYAEIHVFTTCAQDYALWNNVYPAGTQVLNDVQVHRFVVDVPRKPRQFARISKNLFSRPHSHLDELAWMTEQGPVSKSLLMDIEHRRDEFDVFIFFTYLYATTYFGVQLVPEKAMLVPTAHDEPTLYLSIFRSTFHLPRYILYNTHAERRLVQGIFRNSEVPSVVVGTGIDVPDTVDESRFRQKYGINADFILYIGRLDESKNLNELLDHYDRFARSAGHAVKLVLLGKGSLSIPQRSDILSLGFVSEADKFSALAASSLLVLPSRYESLSMVVLEAWLVGKPVLVNGACEVMREQCLKSEGGLYYESYEEFSTGLHLLLSNPSLRHALGQNGQQFTREKYSWDAIERKYLQSISQYLGI